MKYQIRDNALGGMTLAAAIACVLAVPVNLAIGNYCNALAVACLGVINLWLAIEKKQ